jgi:hypothetical protein
MARLSDEDMNGIGEFDERYVIKVNKENLLLLKSIFTPGALKALIGELCCLEINPLPSRLEVFLLNFIETACYYVATIATIRLRSGYVATIREAG